jgi:hypothetical protein
MSTPTKMSETSIATIWPANSEDEWGRKTYGTPYSLTCSYDFNNGTTYTTTKGVEFNPSAVIWFEQRSDIRLPREGDFIAKGDHTSQASHIDVETALPVKDVAVQDCSLFREPDDVRVMA